MKMDNPIRKVSAVLFSAIAVMATAAHALPVQSSLRTKSRPIVTPRAPATSYHFSNIPVRAALVVIAQEGGFSLVVSDSVQGNVSLHLNNVTWQQALDIVLRLKGLDMRVNGTSRLVTAADG